MTWPQTSTTHNLAELGLQDKRRAIKGLVVLLQLSVFHIFDYIQKAWLRNRVFVL